MARERDDILTHEPQGFRAEAGGADTPPALPPLAVSALMVTKADLIAALRVYLPQISDIEALDGDCFLLSVGPHHHENGS